MLHPQHSSARRKKLLKQRTIERISEDQRMAELRRRQKQAVQNLDFDLAEELEMRIQGCHKDYSASDFADAVIQLLERADVVVRESLAKIEGFNQQRQEDEKAVRFRINSQFQALKQNHISQLVEHEKDHAVARLRETERTIPAYENLIKRSRQAGQQKLFEEARIFRASAELVNETDLECRLAKIDADFEGTRKGLINIQSKEIQILAQRLEEGLKRVAEDIEIKISKENAVRKPKLIGMLDEVVRKCGDRGSSSELAKRAEYVEREFCSRLVALGCPVPECIGTSSKTRASVRRSK
jgi:hypothetical protein